MFYIPMAPVLEPLLEREGGKPTTKPGTQRGAHGRWTLWEANFHLCYLYSNCASSQWSAAWCLTSNVNCKATWFCQDTASNQSTFQKLAACLTAQQQTISVLGCSTCYCMGRNDSVQKNTMGHPGLWYIICCLVPRGPACWVTCYSVKKV